MLLTQANAGNQSSGHLERDTSADVAKSIAESQSRDQSLRIMIGFNHTRSDTRQSSVMDEAFKLELVREL